MTPFLSPSVSASVTSRPDLRLARAHVTALSYDLCSGQWTPTGLERRVAGILTISAVAHGTLTAISVRNVLWEGSVAMTQENGGHFARALAALLPFLDGGDSVRSGGDADGAGSGGGSGDCGGSGHGGDSLGADVLDVLDEAVDLCTAIAQDPAVPSANAFPSVRPVQGGLTESGLGTAPYSY